MTSPDRLDGFSISVLRHLDSGDVDAVAELAAAATEADGVGPLSEHVRLHLKHGGDVDAWHLVARRVGPNGSELLGYAHLDKTDLVEGPSAEIVVTPGARRAGVGGALLDALNMKLSKRRGDGPLRIWAHGALPGAAALAKSRGFEVFRELSSCSGRCRRRRTASRSRRDRRRRDPHFPPGADDEAWVALNAKAFA